ncbi:MAG: aminotransferase class V-fold PLP-dependent enzyme [Myxococcales bacterium FL481]|nr:MAG: aminotransferase class V-fold PLP-dependent enzyme [Myxococcales bacterium FL481]
MEPVDVVPGESLRQRVREVQVDELPKLADTVVLIDIREGFEVAGGTMAGAFHVPADDLVDCFDEVVTDSSKLVCLVCNSGRRSRMCAAELLDGSASNVASLRGGLKAWQTAGNGLVAVPERRPTSDSPMSWAAIRADFPIVRRLVPVLSGREVELLYLDHAASTHPPSRVLQQYSRFIAHDYANIHRGAHRLSRAATHDFDRCYSVVAAFIRADLEHSAVVFTGNTTQAIDLCAAVMQPVEGATIVTDLEHHSNDLPHRRRGDVLRAGVLNDGSLDVDHIETLLKQHRVKLVAVSGASNVTGWMPDIHRVAELAHRHGAKILVDAAQLLAHYPIDVRPTTDPGHLDFLAAAGHKAYAPFGAAFLHGPRDVFDAAPPYIPGGGTAVEVTASDVQWVGTPDRHQGGTPNVGGVIALASALEFLDTIGMDRVRQHEVELTRAAMTRLSALDGVTIYGPTDPEARLGVLSFNIEGISDMLVAAILSEERGIACRNGRFCAHPYMARILATQGGATPEPNHTPGAVRASFGLYNEEFDVERLVEAVEMIRRGQFRGRYSINHEGVAAERAARCNDRWMEARRS